MIVMSSDHSLEQQSSHSSQGGQQQQHHSSKGRKGDPRMHKAVQARLERPEISLFQALQVGGFDYPTDEDAGYADSENVTLGQRKNQLSRRLRLAKKHLAEGFPNAVNQSNGEVSDSHNPTVPLPSMNHLPNLKRGPSVTEETASPEQEAADRSRSRMAKNHPQFNPLFVPRVPPMLSSGNGNGGTGNKSSNSQAHQQAAPPQFRASMTASSEGNEAFGMPFQQLPPIVPGQRQSHRSQNPQPNQRQSMVKNPSSSAAAYAPGASGVAIASLIRTATSVGLSLEQLALALGNSATLGHVLEETGMEKQHEIALNLHENKAGALYRESMLLAGYEQDECQDGSSTHLQFSLAAWQSEGKRLQSLMEQSQVEEPPLEVESAPKTGPAAATNGNSSRSSHSDHGHEHGHSHGHNHGTAEDGGDCYMDGRHIHRLEGKCGHKAILHQPLNGTAHIDFLVGNKVECYQHSHPIAPTNTTNISVWPSKYKCGEMEGCSAQSACNEMTAPHNHSEGSCSSVVSPRILELHDIDFDGKEWNSDFADGQIDETLLGLFKLGGSNEIGSEGNDIDVAKVEAL